ARSGGGGAMAQDSNIAVVGIALGVVFGRLAAGTARGRFIAGAIAASDSAATFEDAARTTGRSGATAAADARGRSVCRGFRSRSATTSRMISPSTILESAANPVESAWKQRLLMLRGIPLLTRLIMSIASGVKMGAP